MYACGKAKMDGIACAETSIRTYMHVINVDIQINENLKFHVGYAYAY